MRSKTSKTKAIVLRTVPVTNTSAIVVWFARDYGRMATMIKGAYRPKSLFFGRFDLFYTCELLYYNRAREHLHTARECTPLKWREQLRDDWRACAAASYLCDLMERVLPWGAPHPRIFALLDRQLDVLAQSGLDIATLFWFELRLADLLGLAPRLDSCAACGRDVGAGRMVFSDEHGGLLCPDCHHRGRDAEMPVSRGSIAMLARWQGSRDPGMAGRTRCTPAQCREIRLLLGRFLRYHFESALESRKVAFDIMFAEKIGNG